MRGSEPVTLVTGVTGFIGSAVVARAARDRTRRLRGAVRHPIGTLPGGVESVVVGDLSAETDWSRALEGVSEIVHTAARVHVMEDLAPDPLSEFRRANVAGTLNLARQAAKAGVRRLVFLSSIKVNGERTAPGRPYTAEDVPAPIDPYGISKLEAELGLQAIAQESPLEFVSIRPVLVYGPGVKANFARMMQWLHRGLPLPLGAIANRRSLVALDNVVDLILISRDHPAAANQVFLVSDGEDLSTTDLLTRLAAALGRPARLLPVPEPLLRGAANLLGKPAVARRLCDSLEVNISKTRELLGWVPPVSVDEALKQTAQHFLARFYRSRS